MNTDTYLKLFAVILFLPPTLIFLYHVVKYWRFSFKKQKEIKFSIKEALKDKEVIRENKKIFRLSLLIVSYWFLLIIGMIVSTGYLKKMGYLY